MRGPIAIAAERLQLPQPVVLHVVGNGGADTARILVIAGALDLVGFAVEDEAVVLVEGGCANAELGLRLVEDVAARLNA